MSEPRAVRLALAVGVGCSAAVFAYAALRAGSALLAHEPNPALVTWTAHRAFFWRAWTSAYVGGAAAFTGWFVAARSPERVARVLGVTLPAAAIALAAQAAALP